ncbi:MAG: DUF3794 domain-containing protein [Ruminococcus sp.]|nr:DUF3794 domain-containing protein [Ruminococcus sp.]
MEYHLTKKNIKAARCALDTAAEQAVDIDLTLPDYCPDVERILSCTLDPRIYMSNVSGDRLSVEGGSTVRILYLDGDRGCMRSYEHTQPFSESLPLKGDVADCAVSVEAKPEYMNCRAMSPRKLSLHGAFSLCAVVEESCDAPYYSYEEDDDLQVRSEEISASSLCGLCTESFSVQEDVSVNAKSGVSSLLTHRLSARITELKTIHNKIMFNADLKLELMYLCGVDQPQTECMSYNIPISRVADCEGAAENAVIDGELSVMSADVRLSDDAADGSQLLLLDAKLCFTARCYEEREIAVLSDAFSVDREVQAREEPFSCRSGVICRTYTDVGKTNVGVEDEIGKVIDVHCEKVNTSVISSGGNTVLNTKLCVAILYENSEGEIRCVERDAEFSYQPDTGGCEEIMRYKTAVDSLSYRLTDSRHLELRAELSYRLTLCSRKTCTVLTDISSDDDAPAGEKNSALILYFTESSDSVWDISKRFCSRVQDVIDENDLQGDGIEGGMMLVIPTA